MSFFCVFSFDFHKLALHLGNLITSDKGDEIVLKALRKHLYQDMYLTSFGSKFVLDMKSFCYNN